MKNLKDEIEGKILKQLKAWVGGTEIDPEGLAEVLASLIQQEKERAVREFLDFYVMENNIYGAEVGIIMLQLEQYLAERKGE